MKGSPTSDLVRNTLLARLNKALSFSDLTFHGSSHDEDAHGNWAEFDEVDHEGLDDFPPEMVSDIEESIRKLQNDYRIKVKIRVNDLPGDGELAKVFKDSHTTINLRRDFATKVDSVLAKENYFVAENVGEVLAHEYGHVWLYDLAFEDSANDTNTANNLLNHFEFGERTNRLGQISKYSEEYGIDEAIPEAFLQYRKKIRGYWPGLIKDTIEGGF